MISYLLQHKNALVEDSVPCRLPVVDREGRPAGSLRLMNRTLAADPVVVADLTNWRRTYMRFFLTHFEPTEERTKHWLAHTALPAADRLLFLLETSPDFFIGNFGLAGIGPFSAELDNLIRGRRGGGPEFIYLSECALLWWLFADQSRETATLRVFSNNRLTIGLHLSVGFSTTASDPLFVHPEGEEYGYTLHGGSLPTGFAYDEMKITRDQFHSCNPWVRKAYQSILNPLWQLRE